MRKMASELTESCLEACLVEGTSGTASASMWLEGDYSVSRHGELELDLGGETNIPAEPVAGKAKVGWLQKRRRVGVGKLRVEFSVTVRTV
jgi:hypothetical protein